LVDINISAKKSAERNALLRLLFSKDVRDSLQAGFNRLHACLGSLQLAYAQATTVSHTCSSFSSAIKADLHFPDPVALGSLTLSNKKRWIWFAFTAWHVNHAKQY
jgi:hypothetical protein